MKKMKGGSSSSGGGSVEIRKSKKMKDQEAALALRAALFEESGRDRTDFQLPPMFLSKKIDGKDVAVTAHARIPRELFREVFDLTKEAAEGIYDASGFEWDDADKIEELNEKGGRFLLARDGGGNVVGVAQWRFTRVGEAVFETLGPIGAFVYGAGAKRAERVKAGGIKKRRGRKRATLRVVGGEIPPTRARPHSHMPPPPPNQPTN